VLLELEVRYSRHDQEILCALEDKCHRETPDEESFPRIVEFYEIDGEILEAAEQKLYLSFFRERGFHSMSVSEILRTMNET